VIYSPTALDLPKHAPPKASWPSMSILRAFAALRSWFCRPTPRKRKALGLALIGVCTAGSQGVSRAQGDERPITISLDAEDIEYSDPDSSALLTGNVRLKATDLPGKIPEVEMTTDRLEVSLDTGDVRAPVGATFEMPQVWITGQDLHYNIRSQQLGAVDARSRVRVPLGRRELTVYGQSDRVEASDEDVQFHKASISTCDREHPHYALRARRVRVKVDTEELFVYGGSIYLYGVEVPLVGKFSTKISRVGADRRLMKIPMLGYSAREGVYIPFEKGFSAPGDPIRATADLKLTQRHLIAGTLLAERSRPGLRAWVTAARRVEMEDDITHRQVYDANSAWRSLRSRGRPLSPQPSGAGTTATRTYGQARGRMRARPHWASTGTGSARTTSVAHACGPVRVREGPSTPAATPTERWTSGSALRPPSGPVPAANWNCCTTSSAVKRHSSSTMLIYGRRPPLPSRRHWPARGPSG
jgi:hypothetical protein